MSIYLVDTHCHLCDFLDVSIENILDNAWKNHVKVILTCATEESNWDKNLNLKNHNKDINIPRELNAICVYSFIGLHPWYINNRSSDWEMKLIKILRENPDVGVGEIGIDMLRSYNKKNKKKGYSLFEDQCEVFRRQLDIAWEMNRPVSVHSVHCPEVLLSIIEEQKQKNKLPPSIILHSFAGPVENVEPLLLAATPLDKSCNSSIHNSYPFSRIYFSFSGTMLNQPSLLDKPLIIKPIIESLCYIPINHLLIETDSPYFEKIYSTCGEGCRSEPAILMHVLRDICLKKMEFELIRCF
jgi:Tat protein secretion system quality control protein TatD with DNase activity